MAYPGDGYKMSNYGHKTYTPEQTKEQWRESCTRERRISDGHGPSRKARRESGELELAPQTENYFNTRKTHGAVSSYDRGFHTEEGYSQKLKRDDLQHTQVSKPERASESSVAWRRVWTLWERRERDPCQCWQTPSTGTARRWRCPTGVT